MGSHVIHRIIFEENFSKFDEIRNPLLEALNDYAIFNQCEQLHIKEIIPGNQQNLLKTKIKVTG